MCPNSAHRRRAHQGDPPAYAASDAEAAQHMHYNKSGVDKAKGHPYIDTKNANCSSSREWRTKMLVGVALLVLLSREIVFFAVWLSSGKLTFWNSAISLATEPMVSNVKNYQYPHDHPNHPWHWTRENLPDPVLSQKKDCNNMPYSSIYDHFHEYGYVIFTSCSLKENEATVLKPAKEFTQSLTDRVNGGKNKGVRGISVDADTMELIEYMHGGRRTFPFQTINFPTGTQQPIHSDLVHFDTMPRTLMTAAWTALEDMSDDNGPLKFYPRSHHLGTNDFDEIGLRQKEGPEGVPEDGDRYFSNFYGEEMVKYLERAGLKPKIAADMKYGQTLIWAAGLAHGGSQQKNPDLTRLSQVSHYFFEGSDYYWVPRLSDLTKGKIHYSAPSLVSCKASAFAPSGLHSCADGHIEKWKRALEL